MSIHGVHRKLKVLLAHLCLLYTKLNDVLVINASCLAINGTQGELHDPFDNQYSLISAVTK